MTRIPTLLRAAGALAVLALVTLGIPALLVTLVGNPIPSAPYTVGNRVTDATLLDVLALLTWVVWAQFVACIVVETVSAVCRGLTEKDPHVRGTLPGQQEIVRALVWTVMAVGVGSTTAATVPHIPVAVAAPANPPAQDPHHVVANPGAEDRGGQGQAAPAEKGRVIEVTVERGDSLWSLAETHLGNGESWHEIATLNLGRTMVDGTTFDDSQQIRPGWHLKLQVPAPQTGVTRAGELQVRAGDSLWEIAETTVGDGTRWTQLYAANGDRVADPNLIYPGQTLVEPTSWREPDAAPPVSESPNPPAPPEPPVPEPTPPPIEKPVPPPPTATDDPRAGSPASPEPETDVAEEQGRAVLATLVTGGGVLLGGSLVGLVTLTRRKREAFRQPGETVYNVTPELQVVERALRSVEPFGSARAGFLDLALRDLAQRCEVEGLALPDVAAASIDDDALVLRLAIPAAAAPQPWVSSESGDQWSLTRETELVRVERTAPYPTLVTLGTDDEGAHWLVDLEAAGSVVVTGNATDVGDLLRFVAAELAVNVWSDVVKVVVAGFGAELDQLNDRITAVEEAPIDDAVKALRGAREYLGREEVSVLEARQLQLPAEAVMPMVLLASGDQSKLGDLVAETTSWAVRAPASLITTGTIDGTSRTLTVAIGADGLAHLGLWDVTVRVCGLPAGEAAAITGYANRIQRGPDVPNPLLAPAEPAHAPAEGTVPRQDRRTATSIDPKLDADLADWYDDTCPRPKLGVLGPIELRASGQPPADIHDRLAYSCELLAFLATRPDGVSVAETAEAFDCAPNSMHSRIGALRKWLGADPETGMLYLPNSYQSPAAQRHGGGRYQVVKLLSDADLFERLVRRGRSVGGDGGAEDLERALKLVRGRPYGNSRGTGYRWLAANGREHHLAAAVHDVRQALAFTTDADRQDGLVDQV